MFCSSFFKISGFLFSTVFLFSHTSWAQDLMLRSVGASQVSETSAVVAVELDESENATLVYGIEPGQLLNRQESDSSGSDTLINFSLENLLEATKYYYTIETATGSTGFFTLVTTGQQISSEDSSSANTLNSEFELGASPRLHSFDDSSARVFFELPDYAPAYIAFGVDEDNLSLKGSQEFSFQRKNHNQKLSGLIVGQTYYFSVVSDIEGVSYRSGIYKFTHPGRDGQTEVNPVALEAEGLNLAKDPELNERTNDTTRVMFTLPDNGPAYIAFGTAPDDLDRKGSVERRTHIAAHNQLLSGLESGQQYYYQVVFGDNFDKRSKIYSFTHPVVIDQADLVPPALTPAPIAVPTPAPETVSTPTPTPVPEPVAPAGVVASPNPESAPTNVGAGELPDNAKMIYVAVGGSGDGSSISSPMGRIQQALDAATPGTKIYVRAGNYRNQSLRFNKSGTAGAPIIVEGYRSNPGDSPAYLEFDHTTSIDPGVMPLLDGGSRSNQDFGIRMDTSYIGLKNMQFRNFRWGVYGYGASNVTVDNVITSELGDPNLEYNGHGIHFGGDTTKLHLRNSVVRNATAQAITLAGRDSLLEGNRAYCDDNSNGIDSNTDYYFILSSSYDNLIRNNLIHRVGDLDHGGHGFTVKRDNERNIFENNVAINMDGGGLVVRWEGSINNVFRNSEIIGGTGILARDGASNNLFENISVRDAYYGIWLADTGESDGDNTDDASTNNTFRNITVSNVTRGAITFRAYGSGGDGAISTGNVFENIEVDTAPAVFWPNHRTSGNVLRNLNVKNVPKWAEVNASRTLGEFNISTSNVVVEDNAFTAP